MEIPLYALELLLGVGLVGWGFSELWSLRRDRRRRERRARSPTDGPPPLGGEAAELKRDAAS